jgi:L-ascorbate peroxidase
METIEAIASNAESAIDSTLETSFELQNIQNIVFEASTEVIKEPIQSAASEVTEFIADVAIETIIESVAEVHEPIQSVLDVLQEPLLKSLPINNVEVVANVNFISIEYIKGLIYHIFDIAHLYLKSILSFLWHHPFVSLLVFILMYSSSKSKFKALKEYLFPSLKMWSRKIMHDELVACKKDVYQLLINTNCSPLMLRLAWSDSASFDKSVKLWPQCGGANGAIRFEPEYRHEINKGLFKAICLLDPIKAKYSNVSWADLIQMVGALAVEVTGGPVIKNMLYGRHDSPDFHQERNTFSCPFKSTNTGSSNAIANDNKSRTRGATMNTTTAGVKDRRRHLHENANNITVSTQLALRLPQALPPYSDGAPVPGIHIRNVFYRLGFNNKEIVALCGAHTIGRGYSDRTKCTTFSSGPQGATKYTRPTCKPWVSDNGTTYDEGEQEITSRGIGMPGGCSWTRNWLKFDNSYFCTAKADKSSENEGSLLNVPDNHEERNPVSQNWVAHGRDPELLWLPTDNALQTDPEFRVHFQLYADDQEAFFRDYIIAHKKMSELGARFIDSPIELEELKNT